MTETDRYPNLFLAGAPKCGTTSMHHFLGQHPAVFAPRIKEPGYFAGDLTIRGAGMPRRDYLALYRSWGGEPYALDASTSYYLSPGAARRIADAVPDAWVLMMIRNPVDAAYSQYWQKRFAMIETLPTFEQALEEEKARSLAGEPPPYGALEGLLYRRTYCFSEKIARFCEVLPRERLKLVLFDDFKMDNERTVRDVFRFLGLDDGVPLSAGARNRSRRIRSPALARLTKAPPAALSRLSRKCLPYQWRMSISGKLAQWNAAEWKYPPLKAETRLALTKHFEPEIRRLERLLERDLGSWLRPD